MPTAPPDHRLRDLRRVRNIAGLAAAVETLKLLPGIDAAVLAVEWVALKNALPMALAVLDDVREKRFSFRRLFTVGATENWIALTTRAFGGAGAAAALTADIATDGGTLVLPAPFDGFDVPAMAADAVIAGLAHRAIRRLEEEKTHEITSLPEPTAA